MSETLPAVSWQVLEPLAQGELNSRAPVGVARYPHPRLKLFFWFSPVAMGLVALCCENFTPVKALFTEDIVCWECHAALRFSRSFHLVGPDVKQEHIEKRLACYRDFDPLQVAFIASGILLDYEQWKERHPFHADA